MAQTIDTALLAAALEKIATSPETMVKAQRVIAGAGKGVANAPSRPGSPA